MGWHVMGSSIIKHLGKFIKTSCSSHSSLGYARKWRNSHSSRPSYAWSTLRMVCDACDAYAAYDACDPCDAISLVLFFRCGRVCSFCWLDEPSDSNTSTRPIKSDWEKRNLVSFKINSYFFKLSFEFGEHQPRSPILLIKCIKMPQIKAYRCVEVSASRRS